MGCSSVLKASWALAVAAAGSGAARRGAELQELGRHRWIAASWWAAKATVAAGGSTRSGY